MKGQPLKHLKKQFCVNTVAVYAQILMVTAFMHTALFFEVFNNGPFHKSCHKCFDRSGPLMHTHTYIYMYVCMHGCIEYCN